MELGKNTQLHGSPTDKGGKRRKRGFKIRAKSYFYKINITGGRKLRPPPNNQMSKKEIKTVLVKVPDEIIIERIIVLRGKKVMIDRDLAALYGVTTKRLNEQVKRNSKRFPDDFMFQVTAAEKEQLVQMFEHLTSLKYSPVLPYVFTEHGAVMLASVLNSEKIGIKYRHAELVSAPHHTGGQSPGYLTHPGSA